MRWADIIVLAAIDILARLAVPGALLAMTHGWGDAAVLAATLVTVLALVRGLWGGRAVERSLRATWQEVVDAAGRHSIVALRARPKQQGVAVLVDAAHESARYHASVLPRIIADVAGLVVVSVLVALLFGLSVLAMGALAFGLCGLLAALAQRRAHAAHDRSWQRFGTVARDVGALLDASVELRAHGRQSAFVMELLAEVRAMARAERQGSTYGALVSLFPMGVALLALAAPLHGELAQVVESLRAHGLAEAGLLGATALALGVGLVQTAGEAVHAAPCRRTIASFLGEAEPPPTAPIGRSATAQKERAAVDLLLTEDISFDAVSIAYPGSADFTPAAVCHCWKPERGLAVTGVNGAGKSSLALAMLGLIEPASGAIRCTGVPLPELLRAAPQDRIAYLPQQAFVAPGASVEWHFRLLAGEAATEPRMREALRRVGLLTVLEQRAAAGESNPLGIAAGELSGGELRRLQLARVLVGEPSLVILDEPEAGLDAVGRRELRTLVAELAGRCRVLLIAHDPSTVPDGFDRLECTRESRQSGAGLGAPEERAW
jgi:ABC-type transport system involved in cytochrome bd biosynthesis fused ATPase/permease subunit